MKLSVVLAVALLALPLAAFAQVPLMPGALEISAGGGMSVPFGDFNTFAEPGFGLSGSGAMYVMPSLAIGGTVAYNSYAIDDPLVDSDFIIWEISAHGKYLFLPGPVSPYAKASLGMFHSKVSQAPSSLNDFGIGGGLGAQVRIPTSNIGFFAEGMANSVFTDGGSTNYYAIRGGINLYMSP
jgi:hypothetical protein